METVNILAKKHKTIRCHIPEEFVPLVEEWEKEHVKVHPPPADLPMTVQGLAILFLEQ